MQRKSFTKEFKIRVVQLMKETFKPVRQLAEVVAQQHPRDERVRHKRLDSYLLVYSPNMMSLTMKHRIFPPKKKLRKLLVYLYKNLWMRS